MTANNFSFAYLDATDIAVNDVVIRENEKRARF
jgi:hypothetical protein